VTHLENEADVIHTLVRLGPDNIHSRDGGRRGTLRRTPRVSVPVSGLVR